MADIIEQEIARLDELLRTLKARYEQWFKGDIRTAPDDVETELLGIIRAQGGRSISNPTLRFRYSNIVARYNSFKPLWSRKRREIEEGKTVVPFGSGRKSPAPATEQAIPAAQEPRGASAAGQPMSARAVASAILSSQDPDGTSVRRLYDAYVGALKPGERERVPFSAFETQIRGQVSRLLAQGAAGIKFQIVESEGKVRITSKPLRAGRSEG